MGICGNAWYKTNNNRDTTDTMGYATKHRGYNMENGPPSHANLMSI